MKKTYFGRHRTEATVVAGVGYMVNLHHYVLSELLSRSYAGEWGFPVLQTANLSN